MVLLELFSRAGSVGNIAEDLGFYVMSLDRDVPTDIKSDIMKRYYMVYPQKHVDVLWASLPRTEYSRAARSQESETQES